VWRISINLTVQLPRVDDDEVERGVEVAHDRED
jgi:hypothetical protein